VHYKRGVTRRSTRSDNGGMLETYFINSAIQPRHFAHPIVLDLPAKNGM